MNTTIQLFDTTHSLVYCTYEKNRHVNKKVSNAKIVVLFYKTCVQCFIVFPWTLYQIVICVQVYENCSKVSELFYYSYVKARAA